MLKIYGIPRSRAFRTMWLAKELGLDYENVPIDMAKGETRTPEFLAINPNGHVPAIDDDGFILWESMAINLYLAKKYGEGSLYPVRLEDEARAWQWSFWGGRARRASTCRACQRWPTGSSAAPSGRRRAPPATCSDSAPTFGAAPAAPGSPLSRG